MQKSFFEPSREGYSLEAFFFDVFFFFSFLFFFFVDLLIFFLLLPKEGKMKRNASKRDERRDTDQPKFSSLYS